MPIRVRAILLGIMLAANGAAGATDFTPCEFREGPREPWYGDPPVGFSPDDAVEMVLAFSSRPSFSNSWTVDVIRTGDRHWLQVTNLHDRYSTRTDQIGPSTFQNNVRPTRFSRRVVTIALDSRFAARLIDAVQREISQVLPTERGYGFDGTTYQVASANGCVETWSPDTGTRAAQLVGVFNVLRVQAGTPAPLRGLLRPVAYLQLRELDMEVDPMTTREYAWILAGLGIAMSIALFPVLVALVAAFVPCRLKSIWRFALKSGALVYGGTCLVGILFLPFGLGGAFLAVNLDIDGMPGTADLVHAITASSGLVLFLVWIASSLVVPIWLRRRGWPRVEISNELNA